MEAVDFASGIHYYYIWSGALLFSDSGVGVYQYLYGKLWASGIETDIDGHIKCKLSLWGLSVGRESFYPRTCKMCTVL